MPRLASSTQLSISEGVRSNCRLASATVVLPWMISSTSADFRRAVQRLISSSITALIDVSFARLNLSRFSLGHNRHGDSVAAIRAAPARDRKSVVVGKSVAERVAIGGRRIIKQK